MDGGVEPFSIRQSIIFGSGKRGSSDAGKVHIGYDTDVKDTSGKMLPWSAVGTDGD